MNASQPSRFKRRRILVLAPRNPYPVTGGDRLRIHHIARELARHHELTLLTLCKTREERDAPPPPDGVFSNVHRITLPSWKSWLNTLAALPTRQPLQVAYHKSAAFRDAVQRLAPEHDVVLAHLVRTAEYVRDLKCIRWLEMTDAISMSMQRASKLRGRFDTRQLIYAIEGRRMPAYERAIADDFDAVSLTSAIDRAFLFADDDLGQERIMVMPNGVDAPQCDPRPLAERNEDEIAFVGNLHSLQNFDAAWNFAKHVLPGVRKYRPGAVLRVIGEARPLAARRLAALPGVRVEGVVPSVSTALATARVGVCPIRAGAGIKNKILDYLANGLAVVSTPVGIEGLKVRMNEHVVLADSPDAWVRAVVSLLESTERAQRLADAGRDLVEHEYRWDQCMLPLLSRLEELYPEPADVFGENDGPRFEPVWAKTGTY